VHTDSDDVETCADQIIDTLEAKGLIPTE
jgi:hypothetical protein